MLKYKYYSINSSDDARSLSTVRAVGHRHGGARSAYGGVVPQLREPTGVLASGAPSERSGQ